MGRFAMPEKHLCEITEIMSMTGTAYSVTMNCGSMAAEVRAGQFLHIKCGDGRILRRPIGVCSVARDNVRFVFEVKGEGTRWLSLRKPGDILDILGPLGNGYSIPDGDIIIVGGGLGSPPMLFAAQSARRRVTAVLGFRDMSRVMMTEEFKTVCDKVYLTTDDGSIGIHGTVSAPLEELLRGGGYAAVLACGQLAMQRAVAELCKRYAVPCQVSLEERMGCGVGACLVCVCATVSDGIEQNRRVCKDGPVFNASEVVW